MIVNLCIISESEHKNAFLMCWIWDGTFRALSPEEGITSCIMVLNAHRQYDLTPDGCCASLRCIGC